MAVFLRAFLGELAGLQTGALRKNPKRGGGGGRSQQSLPRKTITPNKEVGGGPLKGSLTFSRQGEGGFERFTETEANPE